MVSLSPVALDAFLSDKDTSPIIMVNLLRFQPDGGRARYFDYLDLAKPILARFGAKILLGGDALALLTLGEKDGWDAVLLVEYPERSAFKAMIGDPEYQRAFKVGESALADIMLQPVKLFDNLQEAGSSDVDRLRNAEMLS
ncbi:DUF1330 domain-containing protein [Oryzifoliimicrobium ureilyticus]|uniref:DUF1330 domain-containing protein n=1 Tax=Oryzifoliimicrobium ureilyticus TaxID=3113724 RepID=UPI0030766F48